MTLLKLIALDQDDLRIISAHLQDAIIRLDEMAFFAEERRFVAILRRFDWTSGNDGVYERRQSALRFEKVHNAQFKDLSLSSQGDAVLELLAIDYHATDDVAGYIMLYFAGGGAVRLRVDCIEAEMRDLGPVWKTHSKPKHPDEQEI